jgi:hypothetical protein
MPPRRAYCNYLLDEPLELSLPLAPELVAPELAPLDPVLSAPDAGAELAPAELEPYCFTQSSRSVPVMPAHWLGSESAPAVLDAPAGLGVPVLPEVDAPLEVLGALGEALVSVELPLVDCAQAALATSAAASAAAMDFRIMKLSLCE